VGLRAEGSSQASIKAFCEQARAVVLRLSRLLTSTRQNFISASTVRDITSLRADFLAALSDLGLIPFRAAPGSALLNVHGAHENLLRALIGAALFPRLARVSLPSGAVKFDQLAGGTVQRANTAKEYRLFELGAGGRVFLHPGSVLFQHAAWRTEFVAYFARQKTSKVFLRDATEVCGACVISQECGD
jgi:ATP-dependent RNA helicase DHX57